MFTKTTLKWLARPLLTPPRYYFTNSRKLTQILEKLSVDVDGKPTGLLNSGMVAGQHIDESSKKVSISLNLNKDYRRIKALLKTELQAGGFKEVDITLAPKAKEEKYNRKGNLLGIKKIIAVSSCKGGVGKSTVAVNVAATLRNQGAKVGIFDSDIYGPSLPTLINRENETLRPYEENQKQIEPIEYEDMKCMSFGFAGQKSAVLRGPIVSSIISQLLHQTHWGDLDYLVVDMPPGTGDIQLSLCQELKFDGAVIVTTPQRLSFIDVIKGIQMFQELKVPILGIVQNMSYYQCSKCGHEDLVFGKGYTQMIIEQFGIENTARIPLLGEISRYSDNGTPITLVIPPEHFLSKLYTNLCNSIVKEVQKQNKQKIFVFYNTAERKIIVEENGKKKKIDPYTLRVNCKCAVCIDELSGAMLVKKEEIDPEVYPTRIEEKGNYAVAMVWSDGHRSSIYPYKRLTSNDIPTA